MENDCKKELALHDKVLAKYEAMNKDVTTLAAQTSQKEKEILTAKGKSEKLKMELNKFIQDLMDDVKIFEKEKTEAQHTISELTKQI